MTYRDKGPWYAVKGDSIKGPFTDYTHAKQSLNIPTRQHHDERIVVGELYRYGAMFIGNSNTLASHKIAYVGGFTPPDRRVTHIAIVQGREVNGRVQTLNTGPWQELK